MGNQPQSRQGLRHTVHRVEASGQSGFHRCRDADVMALFPVSRIIGLARPGHGIHRCPGIAAQKLPQPAPMVVVAVGEQGDLNFVQRDAQGIRIGGKGTAGPCVEKTGCAAVFQIEAQTVFGGENFGGGGVFHENDDAHREAALSCHAAARLCRLPPHAFSSLYPQSRGASTGRRAKKQAGPADLRPFRAGLPTRRFVFVRRA